MPGGREGIKKIAKKEEKKKTDVPGPGALSHLLLSGLLHVLSSLCFPTVRTLMRTSRTLRVLVAVRVARRTLGGRVVPRLSFGG